MIEEVPLLDDAVLSELRASTGDDDEFLRELVDAYVAEGTGYVEAMLAAAAAGDGAAIVRPAHTLKSSSATVGAMRLSAICRRIEERAREDPAAGFSDDVEQARAAWVATLDQLRSAGLAE